jgi:hypothetical protein
MSSHANADERSVTEERQLAAEKAWKEAAGTLRAYAGCAILLASGFALFVVFLAGFVAGRH